jgi:hypothetical protein
MRKRLIPIGLALAALVLVFATVGVAAADSGNKIKKAEWRDVAATLQLSPYYLPGGADWITPLNAKSAKSLAQYPVTGELEGLFKVKSIFFGGMAGAFGQQMSQGTVTANLTSLLRVDLWSDFLTGAGGGTEEGATKGEGIVDFTIQLDGTNAIFGKIVGQVDLVMGNLYPVYYPGTTIPVIDPSTGQQVYLHQLTGGNIRLVFIVTGGTGDWVGANGLLKIDGNPVTGAGVSGKIKVGSTSQVPG